MGSNEGGAKVNGRNESGAMARKTAKGRRKGGDGEDCGWDKVMERWKNWKGMGGRVEKSDS